MGGKRERHVVDNDGLRELLAEWQKILGLQDWTIEVRRAGYWEFSREGYAAELNQNEEHRWAEVLIREPDQYPPSFVGPQDMEVDLVHELLHIPLGPWETDGNLEHIVKEQAINAIAYALVALKRKED